MRTEGLHRLLLKQYSSLIARCIGSLPNATNWVNFSRAALKIRPGESVNMKLTIDARSSLKDSVTAFKKHFPLVDRCADTPIVHPVNPRNVCNACTSTFSGSFYLVQ